MKIIKKPVEIITNCLNTQEFCNKKYRHFRYLLRVEADEQLLVYNLLTRELILLEKDEINAFLNIDVSQSIVRTLIKKWFIVSEKTDDYIIFKQCDAFFREFRNLTFDGKKTHFVIFPTTDCNARCFYCFELKNLRRSMTIETAKNVAKYIIDRSKLNQVHLTWFGGEPLLNVKAIDIITQTLKDSGISYFSKMASNAYLFDDEMVVKAKNQWNLNFIQITLDGTEKSYNTIKAYMYDNEYSPFKRVICNIERLLEHDIKVNVRLNIDMHNYKDIDLLIEFLIARFSKYKHTFFMYISILFDNCGKTAVPRTGEVKAFLYEIASKYNHRIEESGLSVPTDLSGYRRPNFCMSDDRNSCTILPDGELGKCEHYLDDRFYGNIYLDKIDKGTLKFFGEYSTYKSTCKYCSLQPNCQYLIACPTRKHICDELDKQAKFDNLRKQVLFEYNNFKKNNIQKHEENFCD